MRILSFILIIFTLVSCSPQQRLNRLVKRHPELLQMQKTSIQDTFVTDTARIRYETADITSWNQGIKTPSGYIDLEIFGTTADSIEFFSSKATPRQVVYIPDEPVKLKSKRGEARIKLQDKKMVVETTEPPDTLIHETTILTPTAAIKTTFWEAIKPYLFWIFIGAVILGVYRYFKRR